MLYQKNGTSGDNFGYSVAGVGDVNGDGKPDFIVGAPNADAGGGNAGSAYVYSGATGALLYQKDGTAGDNFGRSVSGVGDVNADGRADFIVGSPYASPGGMSNAGSVFVYSGMNGSLIYQINGTSNYSQIGYSVGKTGDVNGDGSPDFIVGAIGLNKAFVYSGPSGSLIYEIIGDGGFGASVAGTGDVNADGRADFIVGAPGYTTGQCCGQGAAFIYSGASGNGIYTKYGANPQDNLGYSVAGAGDVNGDGKADFIVGTPNISVGGFGYVGSIFIYSGENGVLLDQKNGTSGGDRFGFSVSNIGNLDGDMKEDFIVGAYYADANGLIDAGSAYAYSSAATVSPSKINGTAYDQKLGFSVAGIGDVDGDGKDDFIIGTPYTDFGPQIDAGSIYVYHSGYSEKINSTLDIPNDQGRWIRLKWKSLPGNDPFVNQFIVFRRVDSGFVASNKVFSSSSELSFPPGNWEQIGSFGAFGDTIYQTIVPTAKDSTAQTGIQWSVFFVRAIATTNPLVFFDSPLDSGYSVDNLVPSPPSALAAIGTCQGNRLSYSRPVDADFRYFKIYRDTSAAFSYPIIVGTPIDTFFLDGAPVNKNFFYRASAVDFSGNEGNPSPQANALAGLKGDVNIDAILTASDVVIELNAAFLGSPFPASFCAADVNCDGILTAADVVIELNLVFLGAAVVCVP